MELGYDDIAAKISSLNTERNRKRVQLNEKTAENEKLLAERQQMQQRFDSSLDLEKKNAYEAFKYEKLKEFDEKLALYQQKIDLAKQKHDSYLSSLSLEKVKESFADECQKFESIKSSLDLIDEKITEFLGERFKTELYSGLNTGTISLEGADVEVFNLHFDRLLVVLSKIKQPKQSALKSFILGIVEKINFEKFKENKAGFALLSVLVLLLVFFATYAVSSIFCGFLVFLFCTNVVKSYNVYTAIISYKAVKDNLNVFDDQINKKCQEIYDKQVAKENSRYGTFIDGLNTKIEEVMLEKSEKQNSLPEEFKFDATGARDNFQAQLDNKNALISQNNSVIQGLKNEITQIGQELNQLGVDLEDALRTLENSYLSTEIGSSMEFNPKFLFDMKEEPSFFVHSKKSSAFIAEEYDAGINFFRLLCAQLRTKMRPTSYSVTVVDTVNLGMDFMQFVDEKHASNFNILVDMAQVTDSLVEWEMTLKKRNQSMTVKYETIDVYNREMLKNDSVTESFIFIFIIAGADSVMSDAKFIKLLSTGGNLGIYVNVLFTDEEMEANEGLLKNVTKQFQSLYYLSDQACYLRDAGFLLKSYAERKAQKK